MQDYAQRVDVAIGAYLAWSGVSLRRSIPYRANSQNVSLFSRIEQVGEAKVDELKLAAFGHHDVGRPQIGEEKRRLVAVQIIQYVQKLQGPVQDAMFRDRIEVAVKDGLQGFALDVLHYQVEPAFPGEIVTDASQVGMVEALEQSGLLLKNFQRLGEIGRVGKNIPYFLQDAVLPRTVLIFHQVNSPYRALTQHLDDLVPALHDLIGLEKTASGNIA